MHRENVCELKEWNKENPCSKYVLNAYLVLDAVGTVVNKPWFLFSGDMLYWGERKDQQAMFLVVANALQKQINKGRKGRKKEGRVSKASQQGRGLGNALGIILWSVVPRREHWAETWRKERERALCAWAGEGSGRRLNGMESASPCALLCSHILLPWLLLIYKLAILILTIVLWGGCY